MCRKAERKGVTVEVASGTQLIPAFDKLSRLSVQRWAAQQREPVILAKSLARVRDPQRKFQIVAERLGEACRVWLAWQAGEPLASVIVLSRGHQASYWRGAMDKRIIAGTGATELLHRLAIEEACQHGRLSYDLGGSASLSLARYKRTFGAAEHNVST